MLHTQGLCLTAAPPPHICWTVRADEGRVQTSAAAFTKGLLDLEGSALTPILVRWVLGVGPRMGRSAQLWWLLLGSGAC